MGRGLLETCVSVCVCVCVSGTRFPEVGTKINMPLPALCLS